MIVRDFPIISYEIKDEFPSFFIPVKSRKPSICIMYKYGPMFGKGIVIFQLLMVF